MKQEYLSFLRTFLEDKKIKVTSLEIVRKELIKNFHLNNKEISLYLVRKMLTQLEYSRKRARAGEVKKTLLKTLI